MASKALSPLVIVALRLEISDTPVGRRSDADHDWLATDAAVFDVALIAGRAVYQ